MIPLQTILGATLPIFIVLALGAALRRFAMLTPAADEGLAKLVIRILYPCFFLDYLLGNPVLSEARNLIVPPLVGFVTTVIGFVISLIVAQWIGLKIGKGRRTFAVCTGIYNYGYLPIPLVLALFGDRETTAVLLLHNIGVEIAIWTMGIWILSGVLNRRFFLSLLNPPLLAVVAAIVLNATGSDAMIPAWVGATIQMLGNCAIPLGVLLAGASIYDLMRQSGFLEQFRVSLAAIGLRLGVIPAIFIAAAIWLPGLGRELQHILVIQAAMPAAIFPIVLARHYNGEPPIAVKVVVLTTVCSVITMPLWIRFGLAWVG